LEVSRRAWAFVVAAAVALGGSVVALAVTIEDVTQHNGLSTTDASHLRFFTDHRTDLLIRLSKVTTQLGAVPLLMVIAIVVAGLLWWRGAQVVVAVAPGAALGVAGVGAGLAKQAVGRTRPPAALRLLAEMDQSFPSGHAADSAALYLTLALVLAVFVLRRPLARAAVVAAGLLMTGSIGLSRLILGVHWPSDVLAGWALGTTAALMVTLAVAVLARLTPPQLEGGRLPTRVVTLLHTRRAPGLHAA